jgi:2-isopropylmalate synthase
MVLRDYKVRILEGNAGSGARTRVLIESGDGHAIWGTVGVSDNIIDASWEALRDSVEFKLAGSAGGPPARSEDAGQRPALPKHP